MISSHFIASNLKQIKESATLAIAAKASAMKANGIDVISLSTGEPDFDTPDHIKDAAITAIKNGKTKYTAVSGTNELKNAIVHKFARENYLEYCADQIIVGAGAKQVIYNAFMATINPHDEVIIPAPFWVSYPDMVLLAQGKPVIVNCSYENHFKLTPESLEKAISSKTKWVLINSPSNPVGSAYTKTELSELISVISKYKDIYILADDIYEHILFNNFQFTTPAQISKDLYDRILTVNGVSKSYSMTGWRIGYGAGNKALIKAMSTIQSQSTSNPCSISQAAAVAALNGPQDCIKQYSTAFEKRLHMVCSLLNTESNLKYVLPNGAFYLFISCERAIGKKTGKGYIIKDDIDFAAGLLEDALVAVVPGSAFGAPNYFRISYATNDDILKIACKRILDYYTSLV